VGGATLTQNKTLMNHYYSVALCVRFAAMIQESKTYRLMLNLPESLAERLAFEAELALLRPSQCARLILAERLRERVPKIDVKDDE